MLTGGFRGQEKESVFIKFKIVDLKTNSVIKAQQVLSQRHDFKGAHEKTGRLAAGDIFWYN